jgi:hypothetical protein
MAHPVIQEHQTWRLGRVRRFRYRLLFTGWFAAQRFCLATLVGVLRFRHGKDRQNQQTRTKAGDLAHRSWIHQRPSRQADTAFRNVAKRSQASMSQMKMALRQQLTRARKR